MIEDPTTDEHLLKAITDACDRRIVQMPAPMALAGVFPKAGTGSPFKMVKLKGNEELLLTGARLGKRNPIILHLEPIDAAEYEKLEVESNKVEVFHDLQTHLVNSLAAYFAKLQEEAEVDPLIAPFIPSGITLNQAIAKFRVETDLAFIDSLKAARTARREKEAELAYSGNDAWGSW